MTYLDRAVKGDEDSITELLVNAMRPKFVRDAILEFLKVTEVDSVSWNDIRTQTFVSGYGRFDVVIEPPSGHFVAVLEIKTRRATALQETQTTDYLRWLEAKRSRVKNLIFLIPPSYRHREELTGISHDDSVEIDVFEWDDLLARLEELGLTGEPGTIGEILRFISSSVAGSQSVLEFDIEEIALMNSCRDLEVAVRTVHKLEAVIDSAKSLISAACEKIGVSHADRVENEKNPEIGVGKYFGDYAVYVGLTFGLEEHADNLFSVVFQGFGDLNESSQAKYLQINDCYYRKISKYVLGNVDTMTKDASSRLSEAVVEIIMEAGEDFQTIP